MEYDDLILIPSLVAQTVATREYSGQDLSERMRSATHVSRIEQFRKNMAPEQIAEFVVAADRRCRDAYSEKAEWFMECVRPNSKSNKGRDQLYIWMTHWLVSYLNNPERFVAEE